MLLCLSDSADVTRSLQILSNVKSYSSKLTLSVTSLHFLTPLTRLYNHTWKSLQPETTTTTVQYFWT